MILCVNGENCPLQCPSIFPLACPPFIYLLLEDFVWRSKRANCLEWNSLTGLPDATKLEVFTHFAALSARGLTIISQPFFFRMVLFFFRCTVLPRLGPIWRELSLNRLFWLMNYTLSMRKVKVSHFGREHKLYSPTMKFTSRIKSLNAFFQMEKW